MSAPSSIESMTPRVLLLGPIRRRGVAPGLAFPPGGYPPSPAGGRAGRLTLRSLIFGGLARVLAATPAIVRLFRRCARAPERGRLSSPSALPDTTRAAALRAPLG